MQLPIGITERIDIGVFLLRVAVLSVARWPAKSPRDVAGRRGSRSWLLG